MPRFPARLFCQRKGSHTSWAFTHNFGSIVHCMVNQALWTLLDGTWFSRSRAENWVKTYLVQGLLASSTPIWWKRRASTGASSASRNSWSNLVSRVYWKYPMNISSNAQGLGANLKFSILSVCKTKLATFRASTSSSVHALHGIKYMQHSTERSRTAKIDSERPKTDGTKIKS